MVPGGENAEGSALARGRKTWDGIVARVGSRPLARGLEKLERHGKPVVNISSVVLRGPDFPRVANDLEAAAEIAADYFLERGFRHFGFYSPVRAEYVTRQRNAFAAALAKRKHPCAVLHAAIPESRRLPRIAAWLSTLAKPVAILSWNGGEEVIEAARLVGFSVPDEVAVVGSSDDFLCEAVPVPLSAIQSDGERVGRTAGALLLSLLRGEEPPSRSIRLPPRGIVTRLSTETLAIAEPAVSGAVRLIRDRFKEDLLVDDLARAAGVARRVLERRFNQCLGISPAQYLQTIRLNHARHLLAETRMRMPEVAEASGFSSAEYFARVFRQAFDISPLRYRNEHRIPVDGREADAA